MAALFTAVGVLKSWGGTGGGGRSSDIATSGAACLRLSGRDETADEYGFVSVATAGGH